jgi:hypothetical protein
MSFDLYVFDRADLPEDEEAIGEVIGDETRWGSVLTPNLTDFVAELQRRYPGLDADPDGSPWASWPLADSIADGTGLALNIVWSQADRVRAELLALCQDRGLVVYDPQASAIIRPQAPEPADAKSRRWWKRR